MSDQFLGEIRLVGFDFAPTGWAQAQGQIMPISVNTALFALLGTMYGGNGTSNFALPNLQGNVALGVGQGPGLSQYVQGEAGGSAAVTLLTSEVPSHTHSFLADSGRPATGKDPTNSSLGKTTPTTLVYAKPGGNQAQLNQGFLSPSSGGNQPHNNLMPYLALNWIIALQGIFPPRS
jgi:microcystin-dependent protein